jgi:hypothetical protein
MMNHQLSILDSQDKGTRVMSFTEFSSRVLLLALVLAFGAARAWAASYCVATAADLQTALNQAAIGTDEVDYVSLVGGTYATDDNGGLPFTYVGTAIHVVYIQGGYGPGCESVGDASIIDGGHHTIPMQTHDIQGTVLVGRLTIQNGNGGGLMMNNSSGENGWAYVEDCIIRGNGGESFVGVFARTGNTGHVQLVNNLIVQNHATSTVAGAAVYGDNSSTAYIINNTIADNVNDDTSQPGGLFYVVAGGGTIANNIFWNNTLYGLVLNDPAVLTDNDIGTLGGSFSPGAGSSGNISVNPHFVDEVGQNYHLSSASTLAGTGTSALPYLPLDLDYHQMSHGGRVDPGAYQDTIFNCSYESN